MNELHSDIYHICKTNTDIIELKVFKFVKIALLIFFLPPNVCRFDRIFHKSIKIDPDPE